MEREKIDRINELARRKKNGELLTEDEQAEHQALRREYVQSVLGNLETTSQQLASMDLEGMIADVDALVVSGQAGIEQSMEKLNAVDFEALNKAIQDLSDVIDPLAKIANRFR